MMTPREFNNALKGFNEAEEQKSKERWEIARWQTIYLTYASGNVKKGKRLSARDFPIPYDNVKPRLTKEDIQRITELSDKIFGK